MTKVQTLETLIHLLNNLKLLTFNSLIYRQ